MHSQAMANSMVLMRERDEGNTRLRMSETADVRPSEDACNFCCLSIDIYLWLNLLRPTMKILLHKVNNMRRITCCRGGPWLFLQNAIRSPKHRLVWYIVFMSKPG